MGEQNYEKRAYAALDAVALARPWVHPGGPGGKGSPNHKLFHAAVDYALPPTTKKHIVEAAGDFAKAESARARVLAIGRGQAQPRPGVREGIGVVEGGFEQAPGDHHAAYHLLATYAIAFVAARRGDDEVRDLWVKVAGRWFAMWRIGALPDGQVVLPGTRFWPFKQKPPATGPDGLVWKAPGETLSPVTDALYRRLAGLPQRDNRRRAQSWEWALRQDRQGFAAVRALGALEAAGVRIPTNLAPEVMVPMHDDTGAEQGRPAIKVWLTKTEQEIGGYIQGFAPATVVLYGGAEPARIGWAPHSIPEWFTTGA